VRDYRSLHKYDSIDKFNKYIQAEFEYLKDNYQGITPFTVETDANSNFKKDTLENVTLLRLYSTSSGEFLKDIKEFDRHHYKFFDNIQTRLDFIENNMVDYGIDDLQKCVIKLNVLKKELIQTRSWTAHARYVQANYDFYGTNTFLSKLKAKQIEKDIDSAINLATERITTLLEEEEKGRKEELKKIKEDIAPEHERMLQLEEYNESGESKHDTPEPKKDDKTDTEDNTCIGPCVVQLRF